MLYYDIDLNTHPRSGFGNHKILRLHSTRFNKGKTRADFLLTFPRFRTRCCISGECIFHGFKDETFSTDLSFDFVGSNSIIVLKVFLQTVIFLCRNNVLQERGIYMPLLSFNSFNYSTEKPWSNIKKKKINYIYFLRTQ